MNLEQYLNNNINYNLETVIQLLEKEKYFFAMSFSEFPKATEYLTENIQGNKCLLIYTSESIAKKAHYDKWHIFKYKISEIEKILIASKSNSICINYGFNWLVLQNITKPIPFRGWVYILF